MPIRRALVLALLLASCGGEEQLRLVPCLETQTALDVEQVSTLEDAYALRGGADGIVFEPDLARLAAGATWRIAKVDVLVMISQAEFDAYPANEKLTLEVYDGDSPREGSPARVVQGLDPASLQWTDVTLRDPQLAETRRFKRAWWSFDFTREIPESGLTSPRTFIGIRWAASQRPRLGASNFDRPCASAWSDFADGNGWQPYDAEEGATCNWPILRVHTETRTPKESCD